MRKFNRLLWQDDFNGVLDRNVWSFEKGNIRNEELQYYRDCEENAYTEDGCLCIKATVTGNKKTPYYSASVTTKGKMTFLHGRLEIRAKLPFGNGIRPAFRTLGETFSDKENWPQCGEIDVFEMIGGRGLNLDGNGDREIWSTIRCPDQTQGNWGPFTLKNKDSLSEEFHIYGVEWDQKEMVWYIDDTVTNTINIMNYPMFHKPHYVLLNLAVGGNWAGHPDDSTVFPQIYKIDWIRYYK